MDKPILEMDRCTSMRVVAVSKWFTPDLCAQDHDVLFLFGDNERRRGKGGQAVIRDCPNAHGIRTKVAPHRSASAYWSDDNYDENVAMIDEDIDAALATGKTLIVHFQKRRGGNVLSMGTGRSALPTKAPRTYRYLSERIAYLRGESYQY